MSSSTDTIFALSSGRGPAAIAVIRISGPRVGIIMTSGRPQPEALSSSIHFHAKPYVPAAVLARAKELSALEA